MTASLKSAHKPGKLRLLALGLVLVALRASTARAQQPAAPDTGITTLRLSTRLVVLDVVVTDSKGAVVPGLNKQDFTLLEDNKPQTIRDFEGFSARPSPSATPAYDRFGHADWGSAPLTLFVLDELNTPFDEKNYAAFTLKRYLEAQPATLTTPAALLLVNDKGLHPLIDYTRDRQAILRALAARPPGVPDQLAKSQNIELLAESFAVLRQIALASDGSISGGTHGSRSHKNVVWLGRGFPALDRTQLDDPSNAELDAGIRNVVTLLTEARITLYKVDPITADARAQTDIGVAIDQGVSLGTAGLDAAQEDPLAGSFSFNTFAKDTGGQYFFGSNDLQTLIGESLDRGNKFYTLAYAPPPSDSVSPGNGTFHALRIVMRDPNLHATTRTGFYSTPDPLTASAPAAGPTPNPTPIRPPSVDLRLAAMSPIAYDGVSVRIQQVKTSPGGALTVGFQVEDRTLTWSPAADAVRLTGRITAVLVALDSDRRIEHSSTATLGLAVPNDAAIAAGLVTTTASVPVDAKTRFVRLLVQDANGRVGTADVDPAALKH